MFKNKNKQLNKDQDLVVKVNQDLVVRNMPNMARVSNVPATPAVSWEASQGNTLANISKAKPNFKIVGIVIVVGGFILVGGLVYLSYVYIIKPQVNKNIAVAPTVEIKSNVVKIIPEVATVTEQIIIASTSLIISATTSDLSLASSSASSTMNEELNGKQNTDLPPLLDSDSDGLNDEEEIVFGTNPQLADSNNNTYPDLTEINNNYNPAGSGKLSENVNFTKYANATPAYEILSPKTWTVKSLNDGSTAIFTASDDSIIQISVQDNTDKQSILGWYGNSFPDVVATYDKLKSTDNWDGIMGDDGLNFYLTDKKRDNIYVISYIPAVSGRLTYPNVYKLMINFLLIK